MSTNLTLHARHRNNPDEALHRMKKKSLRRQLRAVARENLRLRIMLGQVLQRQQSKAGAISRFFKAAKAVVLGHTD